MTNLISFSSLVWLYIRYLLSGLIIGKHYIWSTHFLILDLPSMRRLSTLTNIWYPVVYMVGYTDWPLENLTKFDIRSIRSLIRDCLTDRMFVKDDIRSTPIFIRDCHLYDIRPNTLPDILYLLISWPVAYLVKIISGLPLSVSGIVICATSLPLDTHLISGHIHGGIYGLAAKIFD